MAKRFTDTGKWGDPWFMDLPSKYKLFWLYLLDACDHAGIWKVNFKVAAFHVGEHLEPGEVMRIMTNRINPIEGGMYWQILKFVEFQYGGVKNDQVGKSIQKILEKHDLQAPAQPLPSPCPGAIDKDKVKDKEKDKAKAKEETSKNETLKWPHHSEKFMNAWGAWIAYRADIRKPLRSQQSIQLQLNKLGKYSEDVAISMIEQTIEKGWTGLFETTETGTKKPETNGKSFGQIQEDYFTV